MPSAAIDGVVPERSGCEPRTFRLSDMPGTGNAGAVRYNRHIACQCKTESITMLEVIDHGRVRELRLAHPPVNALRLETFDALADAVEAAPAAGAKALVLTGRPGCFSAGLDVPHLLALPRAEVIQTFEGLFRTMRVLGTSRVPVAAGVTGHAPAGGAVLAIFCDYRVMAEGAFTIGLNEVRVGLPVPPVIHAALARLVGMYRAERLCVAGALLSPGDALQIGLVDEVVPGDTVNERAMDWCNSLLDLPRPAMTRTRALARADLTRVLSDPGTLRPEGLSEAWFEESCQATLHALVRRLKTK